MQVIVNVDCEEVFLNQRAKRAEGKINVPDHCLVWVLQIAIVITIELQR